MHKIFCLLVLIIMALMLFMATMATLNGGCWLGCIITLSDIFEHPIIFFGTALFFAAIFFFV